MDTGRSGLVNLAGSCSRVMIKHFVSGTAIILAMLLTWSHRCKLRTGNDTKMPENVRVF